ncbi:MAG TPA: site-2 protease family protein [Thermoanaerobaculia bacterium]|nr:site-2 protease family protein [Thermoanaerobaculia bacterium]
MDGIDDRSPLRPELLPGHGYVPPPSPPSPIPRRPRWLLALTLFALTFFFTTTLGPVFWMLTRTDVLTEHEPSLSPTLIAQVWGDPEMLQLGLSFSVPVLLILLAHEMGHYLACRYYRLPATLPYFLPLPMMLGTLGAFIRIRAPLRNRRELFDVGVAGPIAGFVVLVPFLVYGIAHSSLAPRPDLLQPGEWKALPGRCLAIELIARLLHKPMDAGTILNLHPFALAGWFGLLATSINLIPLGQLDGGHILYAVSRRAQRWLAPAVWLGLAGAGFFWPGWWVWCVLSVVFGVFHPPLQNETVPLGRGRTWLAAVALAIFILSFIPRGIENLQGLLPGQEPEPAGEWVQKSTTKVTGPSLTSETSM